ncbi:Ktr system potassium uptake protein B [bacterium BMS3Bbin14]|nr:Ktr system potassium uptake protein B [bacterium BMS3Abin13]GBE53147.1 Ktr system potassium uptake protein B [bacterium BMS3Bbin14]HDK44014.1 potassium transporter TrkH [Desulfobacteraceae bacterium]
MKVKKPLSPITLPVIFFAGVIALGTVLLHSPFSLNQRPLSWLDALFTATSATCVTGLTVVDTGTFFSRFGQTVILCLIQLGGLGIMSFTSLTFYLLRKRVSMADKIAVGQGLLHDPNFQLGQFLQRIFFWTMIIELCGAFFIFIQGHAEFSLFSAVFHSVSAFCNAGFSLNPHSLVPWCGNWGINFVFIVLIVLGGLGFSVLVECQQYIFAMIKNPGSRRRRLSWYSTTVIKTSLFLILVGAFAIFFAENIGFSKHISSSEAILGALFQSVTCRTAGFNTVNIGLMTNASLLIMIILMFIGGAPGSCAGGIKVTTFRVLWAFIKAQLKGKTQAVIGKYAIDKKSLSNALILFVFAGALIVFAVLLLNFTEGGDIPHPQAKGLFMEIVFEAVSAFGTVGLSTGLTPRLSDGGRIIITLLMFIGRLGPLVLLVSFQSMQKKELYAWPEEKILIG